MQPNQPLKVKLLITAAAIALSSLEFVIFPPVAVAGYKLGDLNRAAEWAGNYFRTYRLGDINRDAERIGTYYREQRLYRPTAYPTYRSYRRKYQPKPYQRF